MKKPDYLYHYTSIEGLAYILKSHQIRFSRLDLLDDMTEGQSKDPVDWRKFFYVSCWTADNEESIPLWNLYTPDMKGVRLKLPTEMFKKHLIDLSKVPDCIEIADTSKAPPGAIIRVYSFLPYEILHGENYIIFPAVFEESIWPFPVEYTNDESKLNQKLIYYDENNDRTEIKSFEVAKYKKKVWEFQNEWRFRLYCHRAAPRSLYGTLPNDEYRELMLKELKDMRKGIDQEYFYLDLDDTAFDEMEVLMGPKIEPAQEILVDSLLKTYCQKANLRMSNLKGTIR